MNRGGSALTALDLFSGAGGLTLGLKQAGFSLIGAVESDELANETYARNHPEVDLVNGDIRNVDVRAWRCTLGLARGELDLLAGCPPCQGFSSIRTRRKGTQYDDRNDLVFEFVRFVDEFRPRAVMLENVPGLLGDPRMAQLERLLRRRGYSVDARVMDAASFGVPQRRHRLVVIAMKGMRPRFGQPTEYARNVRDAIGRMRPPSSGGDLLHRPETNRSPRVRRLIAAIPHDGGSRKSLPADLVLECHRRLAGFHDVYGRMRWSLPAPTITGGCINPSKGRFLHPVEDRAITLREAARLQSFPPRYFFSLRRGRYKTAELIGNAFPPDFARAHASAIAELLGNAGEI